MKVKFYYCRFILVGTFKLNKEAINYMRENSYSRNMISITGLYHVRWNKNLNLYTRKQLLKVHDTLSCLVQISVDEFESRFTFRIKNYEKYNRKD